MFTLLTIILIAITPPQNFHTVQGELTPIIPPYVPPDTNSLIFDGSGFPEGEGFSHSGTSNSLPGNIGAGTIYEKDGNYLYFQAETHQDEINQYCKDTGIRDSFFAGIRMRIIWETSNQFDAGFGFSAIGNCDTPGSIWNDRYYGIIFDPNRIIWGDYSASYQMDTTTMHSYLEVIQNQTISVYIDTNYAGVVANNIQPVLQRIQGAYQSNMYPGIVTFGDFSNDNGKPWAYNCAANSKYQIDYVTFGTIP